MRRRDAGENLDVIEVDRMICEQVPAPKTVAHNPVPKALAPAPLGMEWPKIAAEQAPMTKAQRADLATTQEKDAYRVLYAAKVRQKTKEMAARRLPSPRRRTVKGQPEELVAIGISNMAHEEASQIRKDLSMVLTGGVRVLHVRYLQQNHVELVTPLHQEQELKNQLRAIGYTVIAGYSILAMQVRREIDEERRARRNAYCAAKALERALRGNLGRSVSAFYETKLAEIKAKFPAVFTDKGQAEFNLEYGVRAGKTTPLISSNTPVKGLVTKARDNCVPEKK